MGEVYLAQDTKLDRKVAIKLLAADLAASPDRIHRFVQEAKAASALNHPNIITIYEIDQSPFGYFIATEFIDGETLRQRMERERIPLVEVLELATQATSALAAAHAAGIVHRDIKPDNLMVRRDGYLKVVDFGLAKLTEAEGAAGDAATKTKLVNTGAGTVMGTAYYMSPEQAKGQVVDARTDLWSLGTVLYELVAGHVPFEGGTPSEVISLILTKEPQLLAHFARDVPAELERIVTKALTKNIDERYQSAKDLLVDLKRLKRQLELDTEIARTATPGRGAVPRVSSGVHAVAASRSRARLAAVAAVVVLALAAAAYFYYPRTPILTDKDAILLTEFENRTGEPVFDSTLRQGLAVQLQQSPFLDIFPVARVRSTLRLMSRSPDEPVTRDTAREICQRQGLKAFIAGSIAKFDRNYSLTLEAINGHTGDSLALVQVEAEGKDEVLRALSRAASDLREELGESLSTIQKFDAKLEVTTSSLEALKEYALAQGEQNAGRTSKAIEHYRRAADRDPNFALAWLGLAVQHNNTGQPGLAAENAAKAYSLRDRTSEDERARIDFFYYSYVTGEVEKAIDVQEAYVRNYPRDHRGPGNLGARFAAIGQNDKALTVTQEARRLNPNTSTWPANLAEALVRLNRFSDASVVFQEASAQKMEGIGLREQQYAVAFISGDAQALREHLAWAGGQPEEFRAVNWQTQSAAFGGEWRQSQEHLRRSLDLAARSQATEVAADYAVSQAVRAALLGQYTAANSLAEAALRSERTRPSLTAAALAFALAGSAARAQSLISELEQKYPKDTRVNQMWLPQAKAALLWRDGKAQAALDVLEGVKRYETAEQFKPQTLRTMAYLKLGQSDHAATEARSIIDRRGEGPLSMLWPLAHLNLGRALTMQGDTAGARRSYDEFFKLWKNADADLPVLIEARKEYAKLR